MATTATLTLDQPVDQGHTGSKTVLNQGEIVNQETGQSVPVRNWTQTTTTASETMKEQPGCDPTKGAKAVGVAVAIAGIFAGVVGLLVYLGILHISLTNVGTMSQAIGLYTLLGGFGATVVSSLVLGVAECMNCAQENGKQNKPAVTVTTTQTPLDIEPSTATPVETTS